MDWQLPDKFVLSTVVKSWLLHPGSFMQRLEEHGIQNANINVLSQVWQLPTSSEQNYLNSRTDALIREVLITAGDRKLMYARTVIPRDVLTGQYAELGHLENRSLGSILFKDPNIVRSGFELAVLKPGNIWMEKAADQLTYYVDKLWARRSTFDLKGQKLLLNEVFLPDLFSLEHRHVG